MSVCPHCGHCSHCGRRPYWSAPYHPGYYYYHPLTGGTGGFSYSIGGGPSVWMNPQHGPGGSGHGPECTPDTADKHTKG